MKTVNRLVVFYLVFILASFFQVFANPITVESAKTKAEHLLSYRMTHEGRTLMRAERKQKVICVKKGVSLDESPTYYVFHREDNSGFAIIAGDDCMPELIGYSLEDTIDVENMPDALKYFLNEYDQRVKSIRGEGKALAKREVGPFEPGNPIVGPYIKTKWNQYAPYNWLTPIDENTGEHTPTGCTVTAAAQILNYYKWPKNSYSRIYKWEIIRDSYTDGYSVAEGMAIANLMRDLGALMGTDYKTGGSTTAASSFEKIPGYNYTKITKTGLTEGLSKGPLAICIGDNKKFIHSIITDGYDSNGLYHVNWGWAGLWNGYYNLDDLAIIYNQKEIHPKIESSWTYLLKPDYENVNCLAVPAAFGGVACNIQGTKKPGTIINVTLKDIRLVSGNDFNGYMSLFIYEAPKNYYDYGYYGNQVYGNVQYTNPQYTDFEYSIPWDISKNGKDFELSLSLPNLSSDGDYVLVPVYFNTLENPEGSGKRGGEWRPLLHFADGTLIEDILFEYKNGEYHFKEVPHGDFDIEITKIETASTYYEKERSGIQVNIANNGSNSFKGILTATFVNNDNDNDIVTRDFDLYLTANNASQQLLYTTFDFTGNYSLKEIEIWQTLPSGERKTYLNKRLKGNDFSVLPEDSQVTLKLNDFKQAVNLYLGVWNYSEVEIENVSNTDFYCSNLGMREDPSYCYLIYPYRIMAGEKATVYPRIWGYDRKQGEREDQEQFCYTINNGLYDSNYPIEGTFNLNFLDKPDKYISALSIAFYYKSKFLEKPKVGFYSKGTIQRSLWQNGEKIKDFSEIQTDSTYKTYQVCPDGTELNNVPVGNYRLQLILTDVNGYVWPAVNYPLILDEEDLLISVEEISIDTTYYVSYDSAIPVFVTINNPTSQEISTVIKTEIVKQGEGVEDAELHPVILPAGLQTTTRLECHLNSRSKLMSDGTFKVGAQACITKRRNGHLDFGYKKESRPVKLPHEGVIDNVTLKYPKRDNLPIEYYSIDGKRVSKPSQGLYIIKYSDGSAEKRVYK